MTGRTSTSAAGRLGIPALGILMCLVIGCRQPEEGGTQGKAPFEDPASEEAFFHKARALEEGGKYDEALVRYKSVPPGPDPAAPDAAFVRARFRMARCFEEMGRVVEARKHFVEVLRCPNLMASDADIPLPYSVDINLRKRAEKGLARIGFSPADVYAALLLEPVPALKLGAVKSLERVGTRESLVHLEKFLSAKDPALKAAAVRSAGKIRRRLEKKEGR
jgi:hypothetical protein